MGEDNWEDERKSLLERLHKAEKIAAESQAEAAVYKDQLDECSSYANEAQKALQTGNQDLAFQKVRLIPLIVQTTKTDAPKWGKYFLEASIRDNYKLENTKKMLEQIRIELEKFSVNDNDRNSEIKKQIFKLVNLLIRD